MPTRTNASRVVGEIKNLIEDSSFARIDESRVAPVSHGRGTDDDCFFWSELSETHRRDALTSSVDWSGFTDEQRRDVQSRVVMDESQSSWMADVTIVPDAPEIESAISEFAAIVDSISHSDLPGDRLGESFSDAVSGKNLSVESPDHDTDKEHER